MERCLHLCKYKNSIYSYKKLPSLSGPGVDAYLSVRFYFLRLMLLMMFFTALLSKE